jgi:hypothetical protein
MFCHCKLKGTNFESKTPIKTQVDSDGICLHCGYYALNSVYKYVQACTKDSNERVMVQGENYNEHEVSLDLIAIWRESRAE